MDCVDSCSVSSWEDKRQTTMAVSVVFSAISIIFFCVGMGTWTEEEDGIVSDFMYQFVGFNGKTDIWISAKAVFSDGPNGETVNKMEDYTGDYKLCFSAGEVVIGMYTLCMLFSIVFAFISARRIDAGNDSTGLKFVGIVMGFLIVLFSMVGMSNWWEQCGQFFSEDLGDDSDSEGGGPATACPALALIMMFFCLVLHILVPGKFKGSSNSTDVA